MFHTADGLHWETPDNIALAAGLAGVGIFLFTRKKKAKLSKFALVGTGAVGAYLAYRYSKAEPYTEGTGPRVKYIDPFAAYKEGQADIPPTTPQPTISMVDTIQVRGYTPLYLTPPKNGQYTTSPELPPGSVSMDEIAALTRNSQ